MNHQKSDPRRPASFLFSCLVFLLFGLLGPTLLHRSNVSRIDLPDSSLNTHDLRMLGSECKVGEAHLDSMFLADSQRVYVEPKIFAASDEGVLLLGSPNYVWSGTPGSEGHSVAVDSILGLSISVDRLPSAVSIPHDLTDVELIGAAPALRGGWRVLFSESQAGDREFSEKSVFLSHYSDAGWTTAEQLDLPAELAWASTPSGNVLEVAERLVFGIPARASDGWQGVLVVLESESGWIYERVDTGPVAYLRIAHNKRDGLLLLVVHPDRLMRRDVNSLFAYLRDAGWQDPLKLVSGIDYPVHSPSAITASGELRVAWWSPSLGSGGNARRAAMSISLEDMTEPVMAKTLSANAKNAVPLGFISANARYWLVDQVLFNDDDREWRIVSTRTNPAMITFRAPNPFRGVSGVTETASELWITGALEVPAGPGVEVVSGLWSAPVDCVE